MIYVDGDKIYQEIKCPDCKGKKWVNEPYGECPGGIFKRCSTCSGIGKIRKNYKNLTEALEATEQEKARAKSSGIDDLKPMKHDTIIIDDVEEDL